MSLTLARGEVPVAAGLEPLAVARLLAAVIRNEKPGRVPAGKQAIDNDMDATGEMLAALLGRPGLAESGTHASD